MPITNPVRIEYDPDFDQSTDEWILRVPKRAVHQKEDGSYEIRLPIYLTRTYLSPGGAILRPLRKKYRDWLLANQGGKCEECGEGKDVSKGRWTLDHQPPMRQVNSKYIDYAQATGNRVIHQRCDEAQTSKRSH